MYKTDIVKRVSRETRLSQRIVSDVVSASLKEIQRALARKDQVTFPGFGVFYTRQRPESTVKHIRTKEVLTIPARQVVGFRVGALLKRAVRHGTTNPITMGALLKKGGRRGRKK